MYDVQTQAAIRAALQALEGAPDTREARNRRAILQAAAWRSPMSCRIRRARRERRALVIARALAGVLLAAGAAITGASAGAALALLF